MPSPLFFTVGGTVQASGGTYITRAVDDQLLESCLTGEFSFVLTARQMGKSSLMVRTAKCLSDRGVRSVIVDLSQIGVRITEDAWYLGFLTVIEDALDLDTDVFDWWDSRQHLGNGQRLTRFFEEVVLQEIEENVVVFVDEIDSTLSLPFTDDFFTAIRAAYNARSSNPDLKRLTFVLIGVATPSDLIDDATRTPFNIGRHVELGYFSLEESLPLSEGFETSTEQAETILRWIYEWTSGHPFLTQRLCAAVAAAGVQSAGKSDIDQVARDTFFDENSTSDSNLRFVHDMLTRRAVDPTAVLSTYRDILSGKRVLDDPHSHPIAHLKLSGIVAEKNRRLFITNRIYATVFNQKWLQRQWPEHWFKRVPVAVRGLVAASFVAVILLGLLAFQVQRTNQTRSEAELQAAIALQAQQSERETAELNASLQLALRDADSLRNLTIEANLLLQAQVMETNGLYRDLQQVNQEVINQFERADSLATSTQRANRKLAEQTAEADSLRAIAEQLLGESMRARMETLVIALADAARRQVRLGDPALGALLARQAYAFDGRTGRVHDASVYSALIESLSALSESEVGPLGESTDLPSASGAVRAVDLSDDATIILAGTEGGRIEVYDSDQGGIVSRGAAQVSGAVRALEIDLERGIFWFGTERGRLYRGVLSDPASFEVIRRYPAPIRTLALSADGAKLALATRSGQVSVIDPATLEESTSNVGRASIEDLEWVSNTELVLAEHSGNVVWWNLESDEATRRPAGQGSLHSIEVIRNKGVVVTGGDSTFVQAWSDSGNQLDLRYQGHQGPINDLDISHDGSRMASASSDHSIQIWKLDQPETDPFVLQDHSSWVFSIKLSKDGKRALSGSNDRTARLFNLDPAFLADQVCIATNGRHLSNQEWLQMVGEDYPMDEYLWACPSGHITRSND